MARVGGRSTAKEVKEAAGFDDTQWRYFQDVTRTIVLLLLDSSDVVLAGDAEFADASGVLCKEIKTDHKGDVGSWVKVTPKESQNILDILNAQFGRQNMTSISMEVLRWRMMQAFRYEKRRKEREQVKAELDTVRNRSLPSIGSMLGAREENEQDK